MNKVNVLGVNIDCLRSEDALKLIRDVINTGAHALIANANIHALNLAYEQEWFRQFLNNAELVFCDGMGVKLGARLLGYNISERFTPADWVWKLADMAAINDFSIFLLGNPPGVAESAAQKLNERFSELRIVGVHHGYFNKSPGCAENEAVLGQINVAGPDLLLVGFGMPLQEQWLQENRSRLRANVVIPCGALFEYLAGELKRGPRWMTQNYLEWLARVIISPRRYGKRYLRDIPLFIHRIFKQKLNTDRSEP